MALEDENPQTEIIDIIELMHAFGLIYEIHYTISMFVDDILLFVLLNPLAYYIRMPTQCQHPLDLRL